MPYILSRKYARKSDPDFFIAAARAIYCDWYLSDERRANALGGGIELTDHIPETQRWAFERAREWAASMVYDQTHGMGLTPCRALARLLDTWRASAESNSVHVDREPTDENLGWYAAMQAMGHGVGLDCCGVECARLPYLESGR